MSSEANNVTVSPANAPKPFDPSVPLPRWPVVVWGLAWLSWVAFLFVMMRS